jgi:hypothetical protein
MVNPFLTDPKPVAVPFTPPALTRIRGLIKKDEYDHGAVNKTLQYSL